MQVTFEGAEYSITLGCGNEILVRRATGGFRPVPAGRAFSGAGREIQASRAGVFKGENPCRAAGRLDEDDERTRVLSCEEEGRPVAQLVGRRRHLRPVVGLALQTTLRKS